MKNTLIGPESGRMEAVHLVHFLDSFLDIPGAAWNLDLLVYLSCCSKRPSRVRAAPQHKISDLGFLSDPAMSQLQRRSGAIQCVEITTVSRFRHTGTKLTHRCVLDTWGCQ